MDGTAHVLNDKCEQEGGSLDFCSSVRCAAYCLLQSLHCPIEICFLA